MRTNIGRSILAFMAGIGVFCSANLASAAVTKVICVPWEGNVLASHQTWDGKDILLKAVVHTDTTAAVTYTWNFGDGSPDVTGTLTGATKYNVQQFHVYPNSTPETPFNATLTINDGTTEISDIYRIRVKVRDLDSERAVAVDDALWWLYKQQASDGHWASYSSYHTSATASAVHAFEVNNHLASGDPDQDPYVEPVARGLAYIFTKLGAANIAPQTYGNPDTNGNGKGIQVNSSYPIYEGGMIMDAIINSRTPLADSGRDFDGDGSTDTYLEVVQDMVDMYAWGQGDTASGNSAGGWRYSWNGGADNSACQWAAIGMIPAERTWGCTVPQWVKDRNNVWLTYSYHDYGAYSGFGYTGAGAGEATTPSGMVQLSFAGMDNTDYRWVETERYFVTYWGSWLGTFNYYAYYAAFKAFSLALPAPVETFSANGFDWYRGNTSTWGLAKKLIEDQNRTQTSSRGVFRDYYGQVYGSAWATIILSGFEAKPVAVVTANPNPTGQDVSVTFGHAASYHLNATSSLVLFEYDFDNNGFYEYSTSDANAEPVHSFHCDAYPTPCTFPVNMRVTDDSSPVKRDTAVVEVLVTPPPHDPTALTGGPYTACPGADVTLDGSASFDIDEPEGDYIANWDWELDGLVPYDYNDDSGETVAYSWATAGSYDIALRVTDSYGRTNIDWTTVEVAQKYCCTEVSDLTARAKRGKVQLVWTHVGAAQYEIFRSDDGVNFNKIADTTSTYSTYLDTTVTNGQTYQYYVKSGDTCGSNSVQITVPASR